LTATQAFAVAAAVTAVDCDAVKAAVAAAKAWVAVKRHAWRPHHAHATLFE